MVGWLGCLAHWLQGSITIYNNQGHADDPKAGTSGASEAARAKPDA